MELSPSVQPARDACPAAAPPVAHIAPDGELAQTIFSWTDSCAAIAVFVGIGTPIA